MFYPLLVSRNENSRILADIAKKFDTKERKITGANWSMTELLKSLRNYTMINMFVLDLSAIKEKDDDFISLLSGLQLQRPDARIVIFAEEYMDGDEFLDKLISKGYTNIIAKSSEQKDGHKQWEMMKSDLEDCFSDEGLPKEKYSRYIIRKAIPSPVQTSEESIAMPSERELSFKNCTACFTFVGTQSRIGTTSAAISSAAYFAAHGAKVAYVNSDPDYVTLIAWSFANAETDEDGNVEINGIKFFQEFTPRIANTYNIIIKDKGSINPEKPIDEKELDGIVYLVGGLTYDEAVSTRDAEYILGDIPHTLMINFADEKMYHRCAEDLGKTSVPHIFMPWIPDKLNLSKEAQDMFDIAYEPFADEEEKEMQEVL